MIGVEFDKLNAIVDFIYYGEANIYQEHLPDFLNIASKLNLKVINGEASKNSVNNQNFIQEDGKNQLESDVSVNSIFDTSYGNHVKQEKVYTDVHVYGSEKQNPFEREFSKDGFSRDFHELDQKIMSMIVLGHNRLANGKQRAAVCQVCGKEAQTSLIKDHIEANHIEGITIPCNLCEKKFRTRSAFRSHVRDQHH